MGTKLKSIKYALGTKIIACIILFVSIISAADAAIFLGYNNDLIGAKSYYETYGFKSELSRLIHNVVELDTLLIDEEHIRNSIIKPLDEIPSDGEGDKIPTDHKEINPVQLEEEEVINDEVTEAVVTQSHRGWDVVSKNTVATEKDKTEAAKEETSLEEQEWLIEEKLERLSRIRNNLHFAKNFIYYIENPQTSAVSSTNLEVTPDFISKQTYHLVIEKDTVPGLLPDSYDISSMLIKNPRKVYVGIKDAMEQGDYFAETFTRYQALEEKIPYAIGTLAIAILLGILSLVYLVIGCGRNEKDGEIILLSVDKIYNDIQSVAVLIVAMGSIIFVQDISFYNYEIAIKIVLIVLGVDVLVGMTYFFSMLRQFKKGTLLQNTLIARVWKKVIKGCQKALKIAMLGYKQKIFRPWVIGVILSYSFINGILFMIVGISLAEGEGGVFLLTCLFILGFNGVAMYFTFKKLKSLQAIMEAAKAISNGDLEYNLDESNMPIEFASFAQDIQNIQGGLRNAVGNAIKSERMKTDLITNVSHDLKTPLTSIINYVDLLKQEEINNEKAVGYVSILEEKSDRLKKLIEDLIEASKASSGTLSIAKEKVNLNELVAQACGEYEEKIALVNLDIRTNAIDEDVLISADGKHMWRIVENLMSNVIKYSMPHSRVYIDIQKSNGYGILVIKNISQNPLDIDPNQLTERFVRVDESRTTEGSGLGLCIAQSLTDIQGGLFSIDIDGDLFKAKVEIPLSTE